jgi:transcriptional regulator with XRE-family HTH domain
MTQRGQSRLLGKRLARLRRLASLTLAEAVAPLRWSTSKLNRIENGQLPDFHGLRAMLDRYGVTVDRWQEYIDIFDAAGQPGWWRAYGLDDRGYVSIEAEAVLVRDFTLAYVPGLLQTEDYARALFRANPRSAQRLDKDVRVRMIRQKRLTSLDDPLQLVAVVTEAALRNPVGGRKLMKAQLEQILMVAELDTVTVRVLPTSVGAHPGIDGSFTLLSFGVPDEPDMAFVEHAIGSTSSAKPNVVKAATLRFRRLRASALGLDDSTALIERLADEC